MSDDSIVWVHSRSVVYHPYEVCYCRGNGSKTRTFPTLLEYALEAELRPCEEYQEIRSSGLPSGERESINVTTPDETADVMAILLAVCQPSNGSLIEPALTLANE